MLTIHAHSLRPVPFLAGEVFLSALVDPTHSGVCWELGVTAVLWSLPTHYREQSWIAVQRSRD